MAGIIGCQTSVPVSEEAFKIASYNIRMQTEWDKGERNWSVRLPLVVKTIEQNGFDLMGLQEVTPGQLVDLDASLTGWARVGECREGGGKGEASPIYYKTARFELLSTETFALSETPAVLGSRSWETACPRICTWAKLRDKLTGKTFRYYNTHLDHKRGTRAKRRIVAPTGRLRAGRKTAGRCVSITYLFRPACAFLHMKR